MKLQMGLPLSFAIALGGCTGTVDGGGGGGSSPTESGGSSSTGGEAGSSGGIDGGDATGRGGASGGGGAIGSGGSIGVGGAMGTGGGGSGTGGAPGLGGSSSSAGSGGTTRPDGGAMGSGGTARPDGGAAGSSGTTRLDSGAAGTGGAMRPDAGTTGTGGTTSSDGGAGTPGLGAWTTGYVATMYGNDTSGDCAGYPFFSDATPIKTATCSRVVTVATFATGVANNASYYGATGDVSSLWSGAPCTCNGSDTCTGTQVPSCPAEQQAGGNCGICVAVKCDPTGAFSLGNTTHDQDCNKTQFAVVQIIDACPHNHPTNLASSEGWCTSRQPNHVDLSCSALGGISTKGMNIGQDGWLNVDVQQVDCSIGLGLHPL